jgi:Zn-dependent metalloprotease
VIDSDGTEHVHFKRTYSGLPVIGGDLIVHSDRNGTYKSVSTRQRNTLAVSTKTRITSDEAVTIAGTKFGLGFGALPESWPVVYARNGASRLAWQVRFEGVNPNGTFADMTYVVDATTGKILDSWSNAEGAKSTVGTNCLQVEKGIGTGRTLYAGNMPVASQRCGTSWELRDATRGGSRTTDMDEAMDGDGVAFTDGDNVWGRNAVSDRASAGTDVHYGIATAWDYFLNVHGRRGYDGQGSGVLAKVHYGKDYGNAFWLEGCNCLAFGDGDGRNWGPMVNLDTVGHELSHGVTSHSAGLIYSGESGGLNEATSDIFGSLVEFYANNPSDSPDYMIGEEFFIKNVPGSATQKALRYMWNPIKDGISPNCYSNTLGQMDVHFSSGVANHFFYLLAEGSGAKSFSGVDHTSPTCNGSNIAGIGRDKAGRIWFRALTVYLLSDSNYADARQATLSAARDLYGKNSVESLAVASAWSAVSVN